MQGGWQVLGPRKGAIVYDNSVAWEDRGLQGQGAQGRGEDPWAEEPWGKEPTGSTGKLAGGEGELAGSPREE